MSRSSYGILSFKIPANGLEGDELIQAHKAVLQDMVAILKKAGGTLVPISEVTDKADAPAEDYVQKSSIKKFLEEE